MISAEEALSYGQGTWRSFSCPVHNDNNPSARINIVSRKWVCMSCHAKGMIKGITVEVDKQVDAIRNILNREEVREHPESWWDRFDSYPHPYWLSRFTESVIKLYRLGFDTAKGRPCYPMWRDDVIIGPVHRNLDPLGPKYRYPTGSSTSELLFGERELVATRSIVLVEGAMDVVAVREAGADALGTYGSKLHPAQIRALQKNGVRDVYIAYDQDSAGHAGACSAIGDLGRAGIVAKRLYWDRDLGDLGDCRVETRQEILSETLDRTMCFA